MASASEKAAIKAALAEAFRLASVCAAASALLIIAVLSLAAGGFTWWSLFAAFIAVLFAHPTAFAMRVKRRAPETQKLFISERTELSGGVAVTHLDLVKLGDRSGDLLAQYYFRARLMAGHLVVAAVVIGLAGVLILLAVLGALG